MRRLIKFLTIVIILLTILSCNGNTKNSSYTPSKTDSTVFKIQNKPQFKAVKFIDSFILANNKGISKNSALKEHYEGLCTKQLLPLIDKKGLYDDIPFKLITTAIHEGTAYGNFVYDDDKYFIKVQCVIKKKQLESLTENSEYFIKFKVYKFQDGVSFYNSFSKIELPTVNAYLTEFKARDL